MSEHRHLGDLRRLLKWLVFVWRTGSDLQHQVHRISFQGKKKGCKPNYSHIDFYYKKRKHILMIFLVFYTVFHCVVLSAVTCSASIRCIFINSYSSPCCCLASKPVYSLSEPSVTDWQLPADGKPGLALQPQKVTLTPNFDIHSVILQGHGLGLFHCTPSTRLSCPRSPLFSGKRQHLQKAIQTGVAASETRVVMPVN